METPGLKGVISHTICIVLSETTERELFALVSKQRQYSTTYRKGSVGEQATAKANNGKRDVK